MSHNTVKAELAYAAIDLSAAARLIEEGDFASAFLAIEAVIEVLERVHPTVLRWAEHLS